MHGLSIPSVPPDPSPDPTPVAAPALCTAPLAAVLLALISLWMLALPAPLHAVALRLDAACATDEARPLPVQTVHTFRIAADGAVFLDGQRLAGRRAIEDRLQALASPPQGLPPAVRIVPHPDADYRAAMTVLAAAQRQNIAWMQLDADGHLLPMAGCPRLIDDDGALARR